MGSDAMTRSMCIYVVCHREVPEELEAPYRPLLVGQAAWDALEGLDGDPPSADGECIDGTRDNIAFKNFAYCELTALYWIWKNGLHEIVGMMHYRRYLAEPDAAIPMRERTIEGLMGEYDLIVPESITLRTSVKEQFCRSHCTDDLNVLYDVMTAQPHPYDEAFVSCMDANEITPFNIFIGKRAVIDEYCAWLFRILDACEKRLDLFQGKDSYQQRVFGFFAERLFGVWIKANAVKAYRAEVCTLSSEFVEGSFDVEDDGMEFSEALGGVSKVQLFEEEFYLAKNPEVRTWYSPHDALVHYLDHGVVEGRRPSKAFALNEYVDLRPELRSRLREDSRSYYEQLVAECESHGSVQLSLNKVLGVTRCERIDYAPVYDWAYYTSRYDDVPRDYCSTEEALRHFIEVGMPEGRQGSRRFDLELFKEKHPLLTRIFGDDNRRFYRYYILLDSKLRKGIDWRYAR